MIRSTFAGSGHARLPETDKVEVLVDNVRRVRLDLKASLGESLHVFAITFVISFEFCEREIVRFQSK